MKTLHLITVGKLKDKNLTALESDYLKRINAFKLVINEVKSREENLDLEANEVIKKLDSLGSCYCITLEEKGKVFKNSPEFSNFVFDKFEGNSNVALIIGGASGHGQKVLDRKDASISLSGLTFPHKIARLILVEQLYRAQTIKQGHPYHK